MGSQKEIDTGDNDGAPAEVVSSSDFNTVYTELMPVACARSFDTHTSVDIHAERYCNPAFSELGTGKLCTYAYKRG